MDCETCDNRAEFMEPCPACNEVGTYVTHASQGVTICHGCEEKMCTYCFQGCRYTCKIAQRILTLPPPPKLERQLTESKWEYGEESLRDKQEDGEVLVGQSPGHIFKVLRRGKDILRVHGDEVCACGRVDIRYPEYAHIYKAGVFACAKCIRKHK